MKRILTLALACAALPVLAQAPEAKTDTAKGFRFTDIKTVKTGSVKDQNKSGTCWAFSGTSFVEDEIMRKGGPELDLSEMFTVRHCYDDKADKYMRMDGTINFAQGGGLWDIMYVLDNYGLVPEEAYAGLEYGAKKHEHYELADGLTGYLKGVRSAPPPGSRASTESSTHTSASSPSHSPTTAASTPPAHSPTSSASARRTTSASPASRTTPSTAASPWKWPTTGCGRPTRTCPWRR